MSEKQRKSLEELLLEDSFIRFIKGAVTEEERKYWKTWEAAHPDNRLLIRYAKEFIQFTASSEIKEPDPHYELKKFEESLKKSSGQSHNVGRINDYRIKRRSAKFWMAMSAAMILVVLSMGIFINMENGAGDNQNKEAVVYSESDYQTGFGEKAYLHLSDGSRIVLNANSHLTYSQSNTTENSQSIDVHLKGEAWFDIETSKQEAPRYFRVHTEDGIVEVLGTTFGVQTSPEGTQTVLEEGEVRIRVSDRLRDSSTPDDVILKPGEMARLHPENGIERKEVNPAVYMSWVRGIWTFDQTPLSEIVARIQTVFGVKVEVLSNELQEKTISGTIRSENLTLIMEGLEEALQEKVVLEDRRITIGTNNPQQHEGQGSK